MKRVLAALAFGILAGLASISTAEAGVERVVSPGGIEAWLIEDHSNPLISLSLAFRGGAALDPVGKEGLSFLASGLLDEGAGDLDSGAFQKKLADLSIDFEFDAESDDFDGSLRTLTLHRDQAFDLLHLALTRPRFDAEPVGRVRGQVLAMLADEAGDPGQLASRAWMRLMLADHPYAWPIEGTPKSIAAITAADLRRFVAQRFARDDLLIAVVGDMTPAELAPLLDRTFGDLPAKATSAAVHETAPLSAGGIAVIDRDIDQSLVYFGEAGLKRDDPDYYAAALLDDIMGGSALNSRLGHALRVRRGLVYSVATSLLTYDHAGLILGNLGTKNASVGEAIAILRSQWRQMAESGLTAEELADAKSHIIGSYPLNFTSSRDAASTLLALRLEGLPIDYVDRRTDLFGRVTLADAARVALRLYRTDSLRFLVVGRPQGVTADLPAPATQ
jgi:zinc protease